MYSLYTSSLHELPTCIIESQLFGWTDRFHIPAGDDLNCIVLSTFRSTAQYIRILVV